jgi:hypothetical protein
MILSNVPLSIIGLEVERGRFQRFAEVRQAFLTLLRAHQFLPPPLCLPQIQAVDYCYVDGKFETLKSCEIQTICAIKK